MCPKGLLGPVYRRSARPCGPRHRPFSAPPLQPSPSTWLLSRLCTNSGWGDSSLHPTAFAATVWPNGSGNGNADFRMLQTPDLSAAFHVYGVQWQANRQTFYFDGQPFLTVNVTMGNPMYLLLDLWFGSASGTPDSTTPTGEGNSFEVNYVRAWLLR